MKKVKLKAYDERLLEPSKGEKNTCDNMTPDLLISQLSFLSRVLRKSKAISEFVGCCYTYTHTYTLDCNPMHKHMELPVGWSF